MAKRDTARMSTGRATAVVAISVGAFLAFSSLANTALIITVARKVITPPHKRVEDLRIVAVADDSITLTSTLDSRIPGRYSLWFARDKGHARIGDILEQTPATVTRELLGVDSGNLASATRARIGSWYYRTPASLGLQFEEVTIVTPVGPAPAWLVPATADMGRWVIAVHGRGVRRNEALRSLQVFRDAGYNSLLVSYRNDGEAPPSEDGLYALGDTEWEDVDAALAFARGRGAKDIVLMGWSMGGATVLQAATRSPHAEIVRGIVLESPVVDWITALRHQGRQLGLVNPFRLGVLTVLSSSWGRAITGQQHPIDLDRLDFVRHAAQLSVPILVLHSADDVYVPATASRELARLRPDIVTYIEFVVAGHTRLWNYDAERWNRAIAQWLGELLAVGGSDTSSVHNVVADDAVPGSSR